MTVINYLNEFWNTETHCTLLRVRVRALWLKSNPKPIDRILRKKSTLVLFLTNTSDYSKICRQLCAIILWLVNYRADTWQGAVFLWRNYVMVQDFRSQANFSLILHYPHHCTLICQQQTVIFLMSDISTPIFNIDVRLFLWQVQFDCSDITHKPGIHASWQGWYQSLQCRGNTRNDVQFLFSAN